MRKIISCILAGITVLSISANVMAKENLHITNETSQDFQIEILEEGILTEEQIQEHLENPKEQTLIGEDPRLKATSKPKTTKNILSYSSGYTISGTQNNGTMYTKYKFNGATVYSLDIDNFADIATTVYIMQIDSKGKESVRFSYKVNSGSYLIVSCTGFKSTDEIYVKFVPAKSVMGKSNIYGKLEGRTY